jgi:hypothetical protein
MTIVETVLVFVAIPLAIVALVVLAVYGRSMVHQPNRYRPGKAWTYPPAWYLPHPQAIDDVVDDRVALEASEPGNRTAVAVGGANGEW